MCVYIYICLYANNIFTRVSKLRLNVGIQHSAEGPQLCLTCQGGKRKLPYFGVHLLWRRPGHPWTILRLIVHNWGGPKIDGSTKITIFGIFEWPRGTTIYGQPHADCMFSKNAWKTTCKHLDDSCVHCCLIRHSWIRLDFWFCSPLQVQGRREWIPWTDALWHSALEGSLTSQKGSILMHWMHFFIYSDFTQSYSVLLCLFCMRSTCYDDCTGQISTLWSMASIYTCGSTLGLHWYPKFWAGERPPQRLFLGFLRGSLWAQDDELIAMWVWL